MSTATNPPAAALTVAPDVSPAVAEVKVLTAADLETADAVRKVEPVDVPEWGGRVHARELTALEKGKLDVLLYDEAGTLKVDTIASAVAAACLCSPEGVPFYRPDDRQAMLTIGSKSPTAVRRVYAVASRLNNPQLADAPAAA